MAHFRRRFAERLDPILSPLTVPHRASRLPLLLTFWLGQGIAIGVLLALFAASYENRPFHSWIQILISWEFLVSVAIAVVSLAILQTLLLLPVRRPDRSGQGMPLWITAGLAALVGSLLLIGLVLALSDAAWLWDQYFASTLRSGQDEAAPFPFTAAWFVMLGVSWALFTPLLAAFLRKGDTESALARLASSLFLGTVIEAVAIIPLDIMVRRKTSCYCGQGTFLALVTCIGLGTLLAGPAAWLPLLARRRKRWYRNHCPRCGYDMHGCLQADQCPECGTGWKVR
jgi:hypothetical protein